MDSEGRITLLENYSNLCADYRHEVRKLESVDGAAREGEVRSAAAGQAFREQ
jgi:hypothetical protein